MQNKIFGIGLHKTATVSLNNGLLELGFRSIHGTKRNSDLIIKSIREKKDPFYYLHQRCWKRKKLPRNEEYVGFTDLYAISDLFVFFDQYYPDAKFILTTRQVDKWVQSVKTLIAVRPDPPYYHYWYYQNELQWVARKEMHENTVREYFSGRPDKLLVLDVTGGEGYEKLCPFLGRDVLDKPFPHANNTTEMSRRQHQDSSSTSPG